MTGVFLQVMNSRLGSITSQYAQLIEQKKMINNIIQTLIRKNIYNELGNSE